MDDKQLREIASQLQKSIDIDAAEANLSEGQTGMWLVGNRDALLLYASVIFHASAKPNPDEDPGSTASFFGVEPISFSETDHVLAAVQRIDRFREHPELIETQKSGAGCRDFGCLIGCGLISFVTLFLLFSGGIYLVAGHRGRMIFVEDSTPRFSGQAEKDGIAFNWRCLGQSWSRRFLEGNAILA